MLKSKVCSRCSKRKPIDRYYIYTGKCAHLAGKPHSACKDCEFRARNERRKRNPELAAATARKSKLMRMFGITTEDYELMLEKQSGACAICSRKSPDGRRLHVDHCHKSGLVRGLLCHDCNRGIGMFKDSATRLEEAASYLRRSP